MLLSEIVRRYFVLPLGYSEIVRFGTEDHPALGEIIVLTWDDSDAGRSWRQEFVDQEVEFVDQEVEKDAVKGLFTVFTVEGDHVAFIALDGVDLTNAES